MIVEAVYDFILQISADVVEAFVRGAINGIDMVVGNQEHFLQNRP